MAFDLDGRNIQSFGKSGGFIRSFGNKEAIARESVISDEKSALVIGFAHNGRDYDVVLLKQSKSGGLDSSFGKKGRLTFNLGSDEYGTAMVANDGYFTLAGYGLGTANQYRPIVIQIDSQGNPNSKFGRDGMVTIDGLEGDVLISDVTIQKDQRILLTGTQVQSGVSKIILIRLFSNGLMDTDFGKAGIKTLAVGDGDTWGVRSIELENGALLTSARSELFIDSETLSTFVSAKFHHNGTVDEAYVNSGIFNQKFDEALNKETGIYRPRVTDSILLSDQSSLIGGCTYDSIHHGTYFALIRVSPNGQADLGFGKKGRVTFRYGDSCFSDLQIQPDGKILGLGSTTQSDDLILMRFDADGVLDPTFGVGGINHVDAGNKNGIINHSATLALWSDGEFLASTSVFAFENRFSFATGKFQPNGLLTPFWGGQNPPKFTQFNFW